MKIIVTNHMEAHAGVLLSMYAWRWGVEVAIKALKIGLHLGQRQVTNDKERVTRSVSLSVLASLPLVCLYGREEASTKTWSLFKFKERFIGEVAHEAVLSGNGSVSFNNSRMWRNAIMIIRPFGYL